MGSSEKGRVVIVLSLNEEIEIKRAYLNPQLIAETDLKTMQIL